MLNSWWLNCDVTLDPCLGFFLEPIGGITAPEVHWQLVENPRGPVTKA